jgi:predicted alpha/beta-fold hydrolase
MNFSDTSDLRETVIHLQKKYPKAALYGLGISMGANMAIKYAGEEKDKCPLKAIVSLANPFDIHECAIHMSKFTKFIYDWNLLQGFKRLLRKNREQVESHPEIKFDVGMFCSAFI